MQRIRLIHWNADEAAERAERLCALGFDVSADVPTPGQLRALRYDPPDAIVIDLARLPMQGRDVVLMLWQNRIMRSVPVVFVDGAPEKVERVRESLPEAAYTTWPKIAGTLRRAIREGVAAADPGSVMAPYAGRPIVSKLGITAGMLVAALGAPPEFEDVLGDLPDGSALTDRWSTRCAMAIWFVASHADLSAGIDALAESLGARALWIAWPKQSARVATDLTLTVVRAAAKAAGLAESKSCSIDAVWTSVRYTQPRSK